MNSFGVKAGNGSYLLQFDSNLPLNSANDLPKIRKRSHFPYPIAF